MVRAEPGQGGRLPSGEGQGQGVLAAPQQRLTLIQRLVVQCNAIDLGPTKSRSGSRQARGSAQLLTHADSGPGYVRCPCLELAKERKPSPVRPSKSSHGASEANEIHSLKSTLGMGLIWLGPEYQGSQGASHPASCCVMLDHGSELTRKEEENVFEPPGVGGD